MTYIDLEVDMLKVMVTLKAKNLSGYITRENSATLLLSHGRLVMTGKVGWAL
jgi:hypothetical protein